jgi:threonine/homoserine/homoserine lactone efflux protein
VNGRTGAGREAPLSSRGAADLELSRGCGSSGADARRVHCGRSPQQSQRGSATGVETAAGVNAGSLCYGLISAFGLSYALRRWPSVWLVLRIAGSGYLIWRSLQRAVRARVPASSATTADSIPLPRALQRNVYEGFLTNALNPSIASFYLIVRPQFAPEGLAFPESVMTFTTLHIAIAFTWHIVWAVTGGTLATVVASGWPRRLLDAGTGAAMLALAASMAMSR